MNPLAWLGHLVRAPRAPRVVVRDPIEHGLFPVCVATHDLGLKRLFELATVLSLLNCRPGDRVLDLGAGSGFSSEMLARLGYDVVALDLDHAALLRNRQRPSFDRTRIDGRVAVVRSLAEHLPIATASVDGVVGLNVLHHVPDLDLTTREIARVLKPAGHAVFCEPGLEHLDSPETRRAIAEFGENDQPFDLFAFLRGARASGFAQAYACATVQPFLRLVPIEDIELFAAGRHPTRTLNEHGVTEELHRRQAFAMIVRDGQRELTSRTPGVLCAEVRVESLPSRMRRGRTYRGTAHVVNVGDTRWLATPTASGGFVTVGCKVMTPNGRLVTDRIGRTYLPAHVPPGGSTRVDVELTIPRDFTPGAYELRFDLVNELVCWFSDLPDNRPYCVHVDIE